ncbi:MAG: acyltransferase [Lachnospiraceae bacterium]|nr:acyltransferase [Lachnospiraceae bacterium]
MKENVLRKNWIDAAKAVAMFIVVLNHSELRIPGVNFWGGMFFVPAFFLLSGYTYHPDNGTYIDYVKKKAKRLIIPYLVANLFLFLFFLIKRVLTHNLPSDFVVRSLLGILYGRNQIFISSDYHSNLMINLNAPTWFLPALFVALIMLEGFYRLCKGNEKKVVLIVVVYALFATGYHYFVPVLLPWCLDIMPFFLLMMLVGNLLKKIDFFNENSEKILANTYQDELFQEEISQKKSQVKLSQDKSFQTKLSQGRATEHMSKISPEIRRVVIVLLFIICIVSGLFNGSYNLSLSDTGKSVTLMCTAAISSSILLMLIMNLLDKKAEKICSILAKFGKHTLTILCYHYFILVMVMMVLGFLDNYLMNWIMQYPDWVLQMLFAVEKLVAIVVSIAACVMIDGIKRNIFRNK